MKFVSLFGPLNLPEDPAIGQEGDIYYNTTENEYRGFIGNQWRSIISDENIKIRIAPEIFTIGSGTASTSVILEQYHSENIIYCVSASLTNIIIPEQSTTSIHVGSRIGVARGSNGNVQVIAGGPEVELNLPSSIYLTKMGTEGRLINVGFNKWIFDAEYPDIY